MNSNLRQAVNWLHEQGFARQARQARKRRCGECTLCCSVRGVVGMDKPPGTPCPKLSGAGCKIYHDRPDECRQYFCAWRLGFLEPRDRPDRTSIVPDFQNVGQPSHVAWTVRGGPDATAAGVVDIMRRLTSEAPLFAGFIPFGLPGLARIEAARPGSPEFEDILARLETGAIALRSEDQT